MTSANHSGRTPPDWDGAPCLDHVVECLEHLTAEERKKIREVVERDQQLRSVHETQLRTLKADIEKLHRTREAEVAFDLDKDSCALCMVQLRGLGWRKYRMFLNGYKCVRCERMVCSNCRLQVRGRTWMCALCFKQRELRSASGDWQELGSPADLPASTLVLNAILKLSRRHGAASQFGSHLQLPGARQLHEPCSESSHRTYGVSPKLTKRQLVPGNAEPQTDNPVIRAFRPQSAASRLSKSLHDITSRLLGVQSDAALFLNSGLNVIAPDRVRSMSLDVSGRVNPVERNPGGIHFHIRSDSNPSSDAEEPDGRLEQGEINTSEIIRKPAASTPYRHLGRKPIQHSFKQKNKPGGKDVTISSVSNGTEESPLPRQLLSGGYESGDIQVRVAFNYDDGFLELFIFRARNLPLLDPKTGRRPSPYVKACLFGAKGNRIKGKTSTRHDTVNPEYNHICRFLVSCETVATWYIRISVCHHRKNLFKPVKVLGETTMIITETLFMKEHPFWVKLHRHAS